MLIAEYHPASNLSVSTVLSAPLENSPEDDGSSRSEWYWFRLQNGDLILGTFPQADLYFEVEVDAGDPNDISKKIWTTCDNGHEEPSELYPNPCSHG